MEQSIGWEKQVSLGTNILGWQLYLQFQVKPTSHGTDYRWVYTASSNEKSDWSARKCGERFSQWFLWLCPRPNSVLFADLQKVDETFSSTIRYAMLHTLGENVVTYTSKLVWSWSMYCFCSYHSWSHISHVGTFREWLLKRPCDIFREKYDEVQQQLLYGRPSFW